MAFLTPPEPPRKLSFVLRDDSSSTAPVFVTMQVAALTVDPFTSMPVVVLKDAGGKRSIPIWIGLVEASAIATELQGISLDRPQTHDLVHTMIARLGARIVRVEVFDMQDNTFYARLHMVTSAGAPITLDARPSDAIALALRAGLELEVARDVIERVRDIDLRLEPPGVDLRTEACASDELATEDELAMDEAHLELLGADAFGKWKM